MFNAGVLTFQEFTMHDPLPLTSLHEAVLEFLRDRHDAVLFGAQAVNAYVKEPHRMLIVLSACWSWRRLS